MKLLTFMPLEEIAEYEKLEGAEINRGKEKLAYELTKLIHGEEEAEKALSAAKAVGLVSAAVSMLTLETAMLSAFGSADGEDFRSIMTAATSAAVLIFTLTVSVYMIRRYIKETKRMAEADGQ